MNDTITLAMIVKNEADKLAACLESVKDQVDESTGEYNRFLVLRLFKNTRDYYFAGRIHEQVMIQKKEAVGFAEDIIIKHQTVPPKERNRKRGRNLRSLKEACALEPQNYFLDYYQGLEWLGLGKPDKALPCSLRLLDWCCHYLPERPGIETVGLTRVTSLLETFLRASPEGTRKLDQYLQNKINAVWELFHYKFQTVGAKVGVKE